MRGCFTIRNSCLTRRCVLGSVGSAARQAVTMRTSHRTTHPSTSARRHTAALLALTLVLTAALAVRDVNAEAKGRPKLVVVVVVDQMRADYLVRFAGLFTGGFRRLSTQGAV